MTTTEQQIRDDLMSLTHWYEFSKKINVPMTTEKVFETIDKILKKEVVR